MQQKSKTKTGGKSGSQANGDVLEGEYVVEKILDRKLQNGKRMYLVKWENYPMSQNTWEPVNHLTNVLDLVEAYEKAHQDPPPSTSSTSLAEPRTAEEVKKMGESKLGGKKRKRPIDSPVQQLEKEAKVMELPIGDKSKGSQKTAATSSTRTSCSSEKGNFEKDIPVNVTGVRREGDNLMCTLSWHRRLDGVLPENTEVSTQQMREKCPHILLDFYESRIKFLPTKDTPKKPS